MKSESLHLQILKYLKNQKEIVTLEDVLEKFLGEDKGLLIGEKESQCRGKGCYQRMSDILFAINRLQDDKQIVLAHIDAMVAKDFSTYFLNPRRIGKNVDHLEQEWEVTGYYHVFLKEHVLSPIYVSSEADGYIRRKGVSREIQQARLQTGWAVAAVVIAMLTLVATILLNHC